MQGSVYHRSRSVPVRPFFLRRAPSEVCCEPRDFRSRFVRCKEFDYIDIRSFVRRAEKGCCNLLSELNVGWNVVMKILDLRT